MSLYLAEYQLAVNFKSLILLGKLLKLFKSDGLYWNNNKVVNIKHVIQQQDLIDGRLLLLRTGKSNYRMVSVY